MLFRTLSLALLLTLTSFAEKSWQTSDKFLSLKTPDSFNQAEKTQELSTLELYDKTHDLELVISRRLQSRSSLNDLSNTLPEMLGKNRKIVEQGKVTVDGDKGAFFVIEGLLPEKIESLYVYVVLSKGSYSLVFNYPSEQRKFVLGLSKTILASLRRS